MVQETTDFEEAVELTGYGKFHYELLAACAVSVISIGFQNGLSAYVFPAAQCELGLTSFEMGILNVAFLIGGTTSSFLWGAFADSIGRRRTLVLTHLGNGLVSMVCAVLPSTTNLLVCRFLNGFLVGAPGSIIFSYVAEFQPKKRRSPIICCLGLFFTMSWLLLPFIGYIVLPLPVDINLRNIFILIPWRVFFIILIVPEFIAGLWFMRLPETPKFFHAKGELQKSLMVLQRMYSCNKSQHPDDYPVKSLHGEPKTETNSAKKLTRKGKATKMARMVVTQIKCLFKLPLLPITALTCTIMFANMFGIFGLGLWIPEIFIRFEEFHRLHPNASVTIKELSSLTSTGKNVTCEPTFDMSVTVNTIIIGLSSFFLNAVCSVASSKVNFKTIPTITMFLGGLASASIYFLTSATQNLIVASIFQATMMTANMTIGNLVVELFPTQVVGTALCLLMFFGRIGAMASNFLFGYFIDTHCEIPIFVVGSIVLLGGALCIIVPKERPGSKEKGNVNSNSIEISVISS